MDVASSSRHHAKKRRILLWILISSLVVVAILVSSYFLWELLRPSQPSTVVVGCGASALVVDYTGNSSGYLGPTIFLDAVSPNGTAPGLGPCKDTVWTPGSVIEAAFSLASMDTKFNHSIDSLSINAPGTLLGVAPSLPVPIAWNGTLDLILTLRVPSTPGLWNPQGTLTTH